MFDDHNMVVGGMLSRMPPTSSNPVRSGSLLKLGNIHVGIRGVAQVLGDPCTIDHHGIGQGAQGQTLNLGRPVEAVAAMGVLKAGLGTADAVAKDSIAFPPTGTGPDGLLICTPVGVADRVDMIHV